MKQTTIPAPTKAAQFRALLRTRKLSFLLEAHDGLSAMVVQEAGFPAIWGSGLSISAAMGVRDANEASWTQVLDTVEFMSDATRIPILLDGDTGFGNFNNVRRLIRKLEQIDVAAVCLEDKVFPKMNSFVNGEKQPLAEIGEFVGRICAAKDAQQDENFTVVARIEALIAGWGMDEALRRAEAYYAAGADAILIHSKRKDPNEIMEFMRRWGDTCPVIIVPTTYASTPTSLFEIMNVRLVIWANHMLRSSMHAMRDAAQRIREERSVASLESEIASVKEIFRITRVDELLEAEQRYLPEAGGLPAAAQPQRLRAMGE